MTKAKRPTSLRRLLLMRLLKIVGVAAFVMGGCCGGWLYYLSAGTIQTTLPDHLRPTAQYLYDNPQPTLQHLHIDGDSYLLAPSKNYSVLYTDVFLNGELVPKWISIFSGSKTLSSDPNALIRYNVYDAWNPNLAKGLHLAEIRLKSHPFDTSYPVYQWAFKIGD